MRLLLISNSTNAGEAYLEYPKRQIADFLGGVRQVAFVPYAAVTFSYDDYLTKVQARFSELGIDVRSVHRESDPARMLSQAEAPRSRRQGSFRSRSIRTIPTPIPTVMPARRANSGCSSMSKPIRA